MPPPVAAAGAPSSSADWDGRSYGGTLGHAIFRAVIRAAGRWPTYLLLAIVVPYYGLVARKAGRASRAYLARVLGPARWPRTLFRTWRHYFEFGQVLVDRFLLFARGASSFEFEGEGWENIEGAVAAGKGGILLSAHAGAWELAACVRKRFAHRKLPVAMNVVMHLSPEEPVPSFVQVLEREGDLKVIPVRGGGVPFEIVAALERGEFLAMLGDRWVSEARTTVPFLGTPASFPTGPWQIAAATGAPIVPVFLFKEGWRRYKFTAHPPVSLAGLPRGERTKRIEVEVAAFACTLGEHLRRHPYQWFNFYDFWSAG